MMQAPETTSTRPYLIRALYEWCTDNGFTPYVAVLADETTQVPREHVKNGEIVLNISFDATSSLKLGNDFIEFKARFGGAARDILVPVDRVLAIYARENGQGMAFPAPSRPQASDAIAKSGARPASAAEGAPSDAPPPRIVPLATVPGKDKNGEPEPPKPPNAPGARPSLKRVK
jgi:stringent starvation protein B